MGSMGTILFLVLSTITLCLVSSVQFFHYPVPVPAVGKWTEMEDGYQFHTSDPADGTYHFGYDTGNRYDKSYREERRDAQGRVHGRYGYRDPKGIVTAVQYIADQHGFRLRSADFIPFDNTNVQIIGPIPVPVLIKQRNSEIKSRFTPF